MFTAYLCLGGHYASEGDLINEFLRYYNEYKSGIPKAPVYGFRLRITLDETGERKDYFRFCVLASEGMNAIVFGKEKGEKSEDYCLLGRCIIQKIIFSLLTSSKEKGHCHFPKNWRSPL